MQESVTKIVGELVRAALACGEIVHAVKDQDGTPRWIEVKRSSDVWVWFSGDKDGWTDCPFDAVWKSVTHEQPDFKGITGVQLGVAHNALCA